MVGELHIETNFFFGALLAHAAEGGACGPSNVICQYRLEQTAHSQSGHRMVQEVVLGSRNHSSSSTNESARWAPVVLP